MRFEQYARLVALATGPAPSADDIIGRPAWQRHGACVGEDPELFFPEPRGSYDAARAVCVGCTVAATCLDYALADVALAGCWAGTTPRERTAIRAGELDAADVLRRLAGAVGDAA